MGNTPFFSIIVPVFNAEDYVAETLNSLVSQSFTDWELIIVNDASTDSSPTILSEFEGETNILIITLDKNLGNPFLVREKALQYAKGKFVVPIDADDIVDPDYLLKIYERIRQTDTDIVISTMWRLDGKESYFILPKAHICLDRVYPGKELVKETLSGWNIPLNGAFRYELYSEAYKSIERSEHSSIFDDELLSRVLLLNARKVAFSEAVYYYRVNENSITAPSMKSVRSGFISHNRLIEFCYKNFGKDSLEYFKANKGKALFILARTKELNNCLFTPQEKKEIKSLIKKGRKSLDKKSLKDIKPYYSMALQLPLPIAGLWLRTIDFLKKFK